MRAGLLFHVSLGDFVTYGNGAFLNGYVQGIGAPGERIEEGLV